jgi:hypothetical protein
MSLRIKVPKTGFIEIAEECEKIGTFDESFNKIITNLRLAAKTNDTTKTHLLTVSLHAFLFFKGGNYSTQHQQTHPQSQHCESSTTHHTQH